MRIFNSILPGSLPRATIKRRGSILSPSSTQAFRAGQTCPVFLFSLPYWLAGGQASQHDRAHILSLRFLAAGRTSQHERAHSLFFTDASSLTLSHISSSSLSTMRRPQPIYGPLVSGKSFFHHSSSLLNQRILRETNWIFSTPALTLVFSILDLTTSAQLLFDLNILIPVLTIAFQLLLWIQRLNSGSIIYNHFLFPVTCSTRLPFISSC